MRQLLKASGHRASTTTGGSWFRMLLFSWEIRHPKSLTPSLYLNEALRMCAQGGSNDGPIIHANNLNWHVYCMWQGQGLQYIHGCINRWAISQFTWVKQDLWLQNVHLCTPWNKEINVEQRSYEGKGKTEISQSGILILLHHLNYNDIRVWLATRVTY